jgi:NifU-like protein
MDPRCSANSCEGCPIRLACRCLQITEDVVIQAVRTKGLRSVKDIRSHTGAGDGCTCCHKRLESFIEQYAVAS